MPVIENPTAIAPVTFWDLYTAKTIETAVYPGRGTITGLVYVGLGLIGESGEFADQCKKVIRDDGNALTLARQQKLWGELGDVCWYWASAVREIGGSPSERLMSVPLDWVRAPLVGMGTPTALAQASFRLCKGVSLFTQQVERVLVRGGIATNDDGVFMETHLTAIYYAMNACAEQTGRDLRIIAADNVEKLFSRRDRGMLAGDGSNR